jgi:hypothetical protein
MFHAMIGRPFPGMPAGNFGDHKVTILITRDFADAMDTAMARGQDPTAVFMEGVTRGTPVFMPSCTTCGEVATRAVGSLKMSDHCGAERRAAHMDQAMVMYHGTSERIAQTIEREGFRPSVRGMLGPGVYVSRSPAKAAAYGAVVLQLHVRLGKQVAIDRQGHPLQQTWRAAGYDSAWVPPGCGMVPSGMEEDCISDPHRITVLGRAS